MPRACRLSILAFLSFISAQLLIGQQPATPHSLLAGALALQGGASVRGVSFSGTAESIAGSTSDSGSFIGNCTTGGSSQLSLQFSGGSRTETREITNGIPSGNWQDSNGVQHAMAPHNLYSPSSWFCPLVMLSQVVSASNL